MILPVNLELDSYRTPISNYIIILFTIIIYFFSMSRAYGDFFVDMILIDYSPSGLVGSIFLHADLFHLLGNMLFLFVFGGAVCAVFGNYVYPLIYLVLGVIASVIHLLLDGNPAVGASGAVSGLMGFVLAWFPKNKIKFIYWMMLALGGSFKLKAIYAIGFYFALDLFGVLGGGSNVAHFAHIGGLVGGFLIGVGLLYSNVLDIDETTIIDLITKKDKQAVRKDYDELQADAERQRMDDEMVKLGLGRGTSFENMTELDFQINRVMSQKEAVPKFRVLRLIKNDNEIKCFVVNEGDTITHLSLNASDGIECEVTPSDEFKSSGTGVFSFTNINSREVKIRFAMEYNNSINPVSSNYNLDTEMKTIS